jgi:hypothetical protein
VRGGGGQGRRVNGRRFTLAILLVLNFVPEERCSESLQQLRRAEATRGRYLLDMLSRRNLAVITGRGLGLVCITTQCGQHNISRQRCESSSRRIQSCTREAAPYPYVSRRASPFARWSPPYSFTSTGESSIISANTLSTAILPGLPSSITNPSKGRASVQ